MGADRADEYGGRNAVEGELLVRVTPQKIVAYKNISIDGFWKVFLPEPRRHFSKSARLLRRLVSIIGFRVCPNALADKRRPGRPKRAEMLTCFFVGTL